MLNLKAQRDVNAMQHKAICRRLVEAVRQETVNLRRVKGDLREADVMMKAVTQSHVAHIQSVRGGSMSSVENSQWMRTIEDRHTAAK